VAVNEITIDAPPERVFAVLADAERYVEWVVGTTETHDVGDGWPEPGGKLSYQAGIGPAKLTDSTEVLASDPPHRLLLRARMRPVGESDIELLLEPSGGGTLVTLREEPVAGGAAALDNPLTEAALKARNVLALRRLKGLVEESR
jgi:uncharacterized protein YndB with AHSA1/START domain